MYGHWDPILSSRPNVPNTQRKTLHVALVQPISLWCHTKAAEHMSRDNKATRRLWTACCDGILSELAVIEWLLWYSFELPTPLFLESA